VGGRTEHQNRRRGSQKSRLHHVSLVLRLEFSFDLTIKNSPAFHVEKQAVLLGTKPSEFPLFSYREVVPRISGLVRSSVANPKTRPTPWPLAPVIPTLWFVAWALPRNMLAAMSHE
jgi:hypothetical protein